MPICGCKLPEFFDSHKLADKITSKKSNTDFWDTLYVDCRYIYKYEIILLKLDIFNFHVDTISDGRMDGAELQVAPHPAASIQMMHQGTRAAPPQLAT